MLQTSLTAKKCTPCQGGVLPFSIQEAQTYVGQIPGWEVIDQGTKLKRTFHGNDFTSAMRLANEVGELCEEEGHHADITFGWGYCRVVFQTHKINGLHDNDFIMAAKVNDLIGRLSHDESDAMAKTLRMF